MVFYYIRIYMRLCVCVVHNRTMKRAKQKYTKLNWEALTAERALFRLQTTPGWHQIWTNGRRRLRSRVRNEWKLRAAISYVSVFYLRRRLLRLRRKRPNSHCVLQKMPQTADCGRAYVPVTSATLQIWWETCREALVKFLWQLAHSVAIFLSSVWFF